MPLRNRVCSIKNGLLHLWTHCCLFLYSITMLGFYIIKALLELVFTLFSCQIILVTAFVNEILQMCVK